MDINANAIMDLMNTGMSAEEIAKTFTDALNEANTRYTAAAKAKELAKDKKEDAKTVVKTTIDFVKKYCGDMFDTVDFDETELDEAADALIQSMEEMQKIALSVNPFIAKVNMSKGRPETNPIAKFLEDMGL